MLFCVKMCLHLYRRVCVSGCVFCVSQVDVVKIRCAIFFFVHYITL